MSERIRRSSPWERPESCGRGMRRTRTPTPELSVLRWEAELLSPVSVAAGVRVAVAESVRAGVTPALDMYVFH